MKQQDLFGNLNGTVVANKFDTQAVRAALAPEIRPVDPGVRVADAARLTGQNAAVYAWLMAGERLTARSVWDRGVQRLAARILDIERATGVRIRRDVGGAGTCEYWIEAKKGEPNGEAK